MLYTDILLPDIEEVPGLKWIQFHYAGIDFVQGSSLLQNKDLKITSMSGASAIQEGEYILGMLLGLGHHLPELVLNQTRSEWPEDRWQRFSPVEITDRPWSGGLRQHRPEVARLLQPFNVPSSPPRKM